MNKITKVTLATLAGVSATSVVATPVFAEETEDAQKLAEQAVEAQKPVVSNAQNTVDNAQVSANTAVAEQKEAQTNTDKVLGLQA